MAQEHRKKVHLTLRVARGLKALISRRAEQEKSTVSAVAEVILGDAFGYARVDVAEVSPAATAERDTAAAFALNRIVYAIDYAQRHNDLPTIGELRALRMDIVNLLRQEELGIRARIKQRTVDNARFRDDWSG